MPYEDPQHPTRRIGQGMIVAAFVVGIALLTLMFGGLEDRARNPNRDPDYSRGPGGVIEVILDRNRSGHYVMSGSINGVEAEFILDTGATDVVIPEGLARSAGLEPGYASQAMTANGLVTIYSTYVDTLQLGAIELSDVRASINPAMAENMVLLGMSALKQVEFSQRGAELTLRYLPGSI